MHRKKTRKKTTHSTAAARHKRHLAKLKAAKKAVKHAQARVKKLERSRRDASPLMAVSADRRRRRAASSRARARRRR
jgi:hypothetical protein